MLTYKVLARLLAYPEAELIAALPELRQALKAEGALPVDHQTALGRLMDDLAAADLIERQAAFVGLFDRVRSLSLHLFEHVHGDSRARGQAMVELINLYRQHGLDATAKELPDYLPLFLEFLSLIEPERARSLLADAAHILAAVAGRLDKRKSAYAAVFHALVHLSAVDVEPASAEQAAELDEESPTAIDRAWEEAAVIFGPENAPGADAAASGCDRAATILARMNASPRSS